MVKYKSWDGKKPTATRTGTGTYNVTLPTPITDMSNYTVMMTGWSKGSALGREKYFASLYQKNSDYFTVITANGSDKNNGGFTFQVINIEDWNSG